MMIPRLRPLQDSDPLYTDFAVELKLRGFQGEISSAYADRTTLATDNSIYQLLPQLTLFPQHAEDLVCLVRVAAEDRFHAVKLFPRGGGTGTNGQSLGDGVVVDLSRHMNRILEINLAERWARVEAGVVKDQLEAELKPWGLFFAPELSTSNRATIGGMVNTDASGQGSCVYGKTRDHVQSLRTVLMDGTVWDSEPLSEARLLDIQSTNSFVGHLHRVVDDIQKTHKDLIAQRFPKLNRSLTGYDLAHLRDTQDRFDLNSLLCGSEGSLGFVVEAKIGLLAKPLCSALLCVSYTSFDAALRDAPRLLGLQATSIETIDAFILQLAQGDASWHAIGRYFPAPSAQLAGVNLVELTANSPLELQQALRRVTGLLADAANSPAVLGCTLVEAAEDIQRIWQMRKRAVGLLGNMPGEKRPIPFVEDTAVPPEHLADYIAEFRALLDSHGLSYGMFGHADAGVLHVRPAIDMKDPAQEKLIRSITDELVMLVRKYHGVFWGEHGKGLRSEYAPEFFGPLYPSMQDIKAAFDPRNQLNPGKIAAPRGEVLTGLDQVPTRGQHDRVIPITARQQFAQALHCNGNGACFNFDTSEAMCPSWKGSRDRRFSPKGRAALLREWLRLIALSGHFERPRETGPKAWIALRDFVLKLRHTLGKRLGVADFSHEVMASMETCLACKSCTTQCPIKVDIPKLRAKFLEMYHTRYLRPPKDLALGWLEPLLPLLGQAPRSVNRLLGHGAVRWVLRTLNLVELPRLSETPLGLALTREGFALATASAIEGLGERRQQAVIVVQDAFTTHFEADLVLDVFRLLRTLGFVPLLAPYLPNGKPLQVHGLLRRFEATARRNAQMLNALAASGIPLIGIEPALTLTYQAEYRELMAEHAPPVKLLQEWLAEVLPERVGPWAGAGPGAREHSFDLLPHCTEQTNAAAALAQWRRVFHTFGLRLDILSVGCCGMAGTFGHEASNRPLSEKIYRLSWGHELGKRSVGRTLMATGYSCRCQARIVDGIDLPHPAQSLLKWLSGAPPMAAHVRATMPR